MVYCVGYGDSSAFYYYAKNVHGGFSSFSKGCQRHIGYGMAKSLQRIPTHMGGRIDILKNRVLHELLSTWSPKVYSVVIPFRVVSESYFN